MNNRNSKTRIVVPGGAPNAMELSLALEVLGRCGYRLQRTTNYIKVYPIDNERCTFLNKMEADGRGRPIAHLWCDYGYFSNTWSDRDGHIRTNWMWEEVTTSFLVVAKLVYDCAVGDGWRPIDGWNPEKGGDRIGAWWEFAERLWRSDLKINWLAVNPLQDWSEEV